LQNAAKVTAENGILRVIFGVVLASYTRYSVNNCQSNLKFIVDFYWFCARGLHSLCCTPTIVSVEKLVQLRGTVSGTVNETACRKHMAVKLELLQAAEVSSDIIRGHHTVCVLLSCPTNIALRWAEWPSRIRSFRRGMAGLHASPMMETFQFIFFFYPKH
jgi:hypothetical protein